MRTIRVHLQTNNNYSTFNVYTSNSANGPWVLVPAPNNIVTRENLAVAVGHPISGVPVGATHIKLVATTGYCQGNEVVLPITQQVV